MYCVFIETSWGASQSTIPPATITKRTIPVVSGFLPPFLRFREDLPKDKILIEINLWGQYTTHVLEFTRYLSIRDSQNRNFEV